MTAIADQSRELDLEIYDGHLIVSSGGETLLLDTGAPMSVASRGVFEFLGREWPAQRNYLGFTTTQLSQHVACTGMRIG